MSARGLGAGGLRHIIAAGAAPVQVQRVGRRRAGSHAGAEGEEAPNVTSVEEALQAVQGLDVCMNQRELAKLFRFIATQSGTTAPLFADDKTYLSHLPVRERHGRNPLVLHELPFYSHKEDIDFMTEALEELHDGLRSVVSYVSAPSISGKSASVLPVFLNSAKRGRDRAFTHYVHIAFHNNGGRFFKFSGTLADNKIVAEKQGAAFMLEVLRKQLTEPITFGTDVEASINADDPADPAAVARVVGRLLHEQLGPMHHVLIHVDEHRKMCVRENKGKDPGAAFSRGALTALAQAKGVQVVATYTEPVDSIPPEASSEVCRHPVPLPCLDVKQLVESDRVPWLKVPDVRASELRQTTPTRAIATLYFRLAAKLQWDLKLASMHTTNSKRWTELRKAWEKATTLPAEQRLEQYRVACESSFPGVAKAQEGASEILCGVEDSKEVTKYAQRQAGNLVVLRGGRISFSLPALLGMYDPNVPVYTEGRDRFKEVLESEDLLAGTPLEEAYTWALACRHAIDRTKFLKPNHVWKCTAIKRGRLFAGREWRTKALMGGGGVEGFANNLNAMEPDVLYCADEPGRAGSRAGYSHPLADMFFLTSDRETVVMIDVAGTESEASVVRKANRLTDFVRGSKREAFKAELKDHLGEEFGEVSFHGVVLAPAATERPARARPLKSFDVDMVTVVRGKKARDLLGGLDQVFRWMVEPFDDEANESDA